MVDYKIIDVDLNSQISFKEPINSRVCKTLRNLTQMMKDGHKCKLVAPERNLTPKEIEQYRRFFCKKAKEDAVNYIYFTVPVEVINVQV